MPKENLAKRELICSLQGLNPQPLVGKSNKSNTSLNAEARF